MHALWHGTKRVEPFYIVLILVFTSLSGIFVIFTLCPECGPGLDVLSRLVHVFGGRSLRYAPVPRQSPGNITILPLGDSITMGYWSSGPYNGYRLRLLNLLTGTEPFWATNQTVNPDALFQNVTCIGPEHHGNFSQNSHFGYGGNRIDEIHKKFRHTVMTSHVHPDAVLLMAGTNDVDQDYFLDEAPARLGKLVDDIFWRFPQTVVVLAQLTPVKRNATTTRRKIAFNEAIPNLIQARRDADWKILGVNMSAALLPSDLADKLHPMDRGYAKMATEWTKGLAEAKALGWFDWKIPL